jgi:hypothetical protein
LTKRASQFQEQEYENANQWVLRLAEERGGGDDSVPGTLGLSTWTLRPPLLVSSAIPLGGDCLFFADCVGKPSMLAAAVGRARWARSGQRTSRRVSGYR